MGLTKENKATEQMPIGTRSVEPLVCSVDGCDKPQKAQQLCGTHYQRKRRTGSPDTVNKPGPKPRNGRDPATRNMFALAALGTKSKRTESRVHRIDRIVDYLNYRAEEQFGCTGHNFRYWIGRNDDRPVYLRSVSAELEYAEVLLYLADKCPDDWLRVVNEACARDQRICAKHGFEPHCTGNHTAEEPVRD